MVRWRALPRPRDAQRLRRAVSRFNRGCYGCFGPKETPNTRSLTQWMSKLGCSRADILRSFRTYNAEADAFRRESMAHED